MNKILRNISLLFFIVLFSCDEDTEKQNSSNNHAEKPRTEINNRKYLYELIEKAITFGDHKAYNEVHNIYTLESKDEEFLYVSMIMANKYNNPEACFDVYWALTNPSSGGLIQNQDSTTKNIGLYYLMKSHELGFESAEYHIKDLFKGKTEIPTSCSYLTRISNNCKTKE